MALRERLLSTILLLCTIANGAYGELLCLSCMGKPSSTDCAFVEKCGSHSVCYIEMIIQSAGSIYFNMGCRDRLQCHTHRRRKSTGNDTEVFSSTYLQNAPVNISTLENRSKHVLSYSEEFKQSTENEVQRRDGNLVCAHCCSDENLCNDRGCGQAGFSKTRGPICYACDQQIRPDSCREIVECGRDDMCYIEEINLAQDTIYHTTCRSKFKCHDNNIVMVSTPTIIIGRDVNNYSRVNDDVIKKSRDNKTHTRSVGAAKGCCKTDLCNTIVPQNGNWGPWTTWDTCSASCGYNGSRKRYRKCEFPPPNYGGLPCVGGATEVDVTCAHFPCSQGVVCLSCPSSISPRTCNYVETCGPNSVCYLEQYVNHVGEVRYQSGCRDKLQCGNGFRKRKRFMVNGDHLSCTECCHGNLCNSHGCGEPRNTHRGPVCYSCSQQRDTDHCNQIDVCDDSQSCGLLRHKFVDTYYQTLCLNKGRCVSDDSKSDYYPKCCTTSLCTFSSQFTTLSNSQTVHHGFTKAPSTKSTVHHGFTTAPSTQSTVHHGFTTAPSTQSTVHHGFTTAPSTQSTVHHGFTTAPATQSTVHHGFTTAPSTQSTVHHGFTTAPLTQSTVHNGFTTAPSTQSTVHHGFTTAPVTKPTVHNGFTTAPPTKSTVTPTHQALGQWSEWGEWGYCLEPQAGVTGVHERFRHCYNPNHTPPDSCVDGYTESERQYCDGGGTNSCIPAKITGIQMAGYWKLGGYVQLNCSVTGHPKPDVVWLTHTDKSDTTVQTDNGSPTQILIGPIEQKHQGIYICEASNKCSKAVTKEFPAPDLTTT